MFAAVTAAAVTGIQGNLVQVEADVSTGLPSVTMVGYLNSQVREAQERVRSAYRNFPRTQKDYLKSFTGRLKKGRNCL